MTNVESGKSCKRHVEEWGAIALPHGVSANQAIRETNTVAINSAIAETHNDGGGELRFGPGVYFTNGAIGLEVASDTNVSLIIRGCGLFPTRIVSNNANEPCVKFHTTVGNIRSLLMENLALRGGRHNLSLHNAAYNRFENILFWGGTNLTDTHWGVQSVNGQQNQFNRCQFVETGANHADSALFLSSKYESLNDCTFGENSGSIAAATASNISINGGTGYGARYRGHNGWKWFGTEEEREVDLLMQDQLDTSFLLNVESGVTINGLSMGTYKVFAAARSAELLQINGCQIRSSSSPGAGAGEVPFEGFINLVNNPPPNRIALLVNGNIFWAQTHPLNDGTLGSDEGYIIKESSSGTPLKGCIVTNNIFLSAPGANLEPLATSAPTLVDTVANGNLVSNTSKAF